MLIRRICCFIEFIYSAVSTTENGLKLPFLATLPHLLPFLNETENPNDYGTHGANGTTAGVSGVPAQCMEL
jgi:hypothetical protein